MKHKKIPIRFTGQHFTVDYKLIRKMIRIAEVNMEDTVIDIGAGKGAIISEMISLDISLIAIENDRRLATNLTKRFSKFKNITILNQSITKTEAVKMPFKTISNIPYRHTAFIMDYLMYRCFGQFQGGCIIMQREAAEKYCKNRSFNPKMHFYHAFFEIKFLQVVHPNSFIPPPTVDSGMIMIKPRINVRNIDPQKYHSFINILFANTTDSIYKALNRIFRKRDSRYLIKRSKLRTDVTLGDIPTYKFQMYFEYMLQFVPESKHPHIR